MTPLPTIDDTAERCGTCRYYAPVDHEGQCSDPAGRCRRYPPVLNPVSLRECAEDLASQDDGEEPRYAAMTEGDRPWNWAQPVVYEWDWCGEYAAKREGGAKR